MELTKQAIQKHKQAIDGLDGYIIIASEIEDNVTLNPDIAIEACKSLIEGLCKKALELLSDEYKTTKSVRKNCDNNLPFLVKQAFENIYRNKFEIDIHNALYKIIRSKVKIDKFINTSAEIIFENTKEAILKISVIRDNRGDICHGRIYPKKDESEVHLAKSIASITDGICSFMINEFSSQYIVFEVSNKKLIYDDLISFNEWLDNKHNVLSVKIDFSNLLYKNAYDKYEEYYYSEEYLEILENEIEEVVTEEKIIESITESSKNEVIPEIGLSEQILKAQQEIPQLTEEQSKKLYEVTFGRKEEVKPIVQLINTFDEKTFWTEKRIQDLNQFADVNSFYVVGLKKIIEDYIAFNDEPLRDNIGKIMKHPPSLADRRTALLVMLEIVMDFANELKEK
ncbi:hypothetical protein E0I26_11295 [Flavobacterium rhamnosiphilum]|uniref:Uncharacterized protein n=1 Tax=Flavobacterium rhamnosiphilum TaxID=2541724 RepID=A0A4R5F5W2_9FLAO|nr:hypothetical protein [Flavobacterium rhamnosiphilum]TDE43191.1 hypothetical protein E0I26_11295 [Flavobacterium rhamnosiphilum]